MSAGTSDTTRTLAVVSAGVSAPSSTRLLADRLAEAAAAALRARRDEVVVEVVELREHAHDLANNLLTSFASPSLQAAKDTVTGADGVVAVTPIHSASFSGLFKMFFDLLHPGALEGVPVLLGATAGTARHSLALEYAVRPLFAYLKAAVVPTAVLAAADDWASGGEDEPALAGRVQRAGEQLADLVAARQPRVRTDPFVDVVPFERLLGRGD